MAWDAFISYATEEAPFVKQLADALQRAELKIWFDQFALTAGDGLLASIDRGLRESKYGIVILSENFFRKRWPQRKLAGLVTREDEGGKVIIPVWYRITVQQVREFSPLLADKVSVVWKEDMSDLVTGIIRAILADETRPQGFSPLRERLPDGTEVVYLPVRPSADCALVIGRHPVTNGEYRRFVESAGHPAPYGCDFVDDEWVHGFDPWANERFSGPNLPVVCVDFWDAWSYSRWVSEMGADTFVPNVSLWELAAFGGRPDRRLELKQIPQNIHHRAKRPAPIDQDGTRANTAGVSDMFGNVWEWCCGDEISEDRLATVAAPRSPPAALRGGSFYDDLMQVDWAVSLDALPKGEGSKHNDIGFRVAARLPLKRLSQETRSILEAQAPLPDRLWRSLPSRSGVTLRSGVAGVDSGPGAA